MGEFTDLLQTISLTLGGAWASGINLYAPAALLGAGGATGVVESPGGFAGLWAALSSPMLFLAILAVFLTLICLMLPKIVRGTAAVIRRLGSWLGVRRAEPGRPAS